MAAYADYTYAVETYGEPYVIVSCDRDLNGAIDTTSFDLLCLQATARINGYIGGRIPLPLDPVPELLRILCVDLAIYAGCPTADVLTNQKSERFKQAMQDLHQIAQGKLRLIREPEQTVAPVDPLRASVETETQRTIYLIEGVRSFTRDKTGIL